MDEEEEELKAHEANREKEGSLKWRAKEEEYYQLENSGEMEGDLIDSLPPGGEYQREPEDDEKEHVKFYEDIGKKLKERGFDKPSSYQQQLLE